MQHKNRFALLLLFGFVLISFSCNRHPRNEKRYPIEGKIIAVNKTDRTATINHKDIPGYMPGMTMEFKIKNDTHLEIMKPGDQIPGTLVVADIRSAVAIISIPHGATHMS